MKIVSELFVISAPENKEELGLQQQMSRQGLRNCKMELKERHRCSNTTKDLSRR